MNSDNFKQYLNGRKVTTEDEYLEVLLFIEWLERKIEGKWEDPEKKKYVDSHELLAHALLEYDTEHDIDKKIEEHKREEMPF